MIDLEFYLQLGMSVLVIGAALFFMWQAIKPK